MATQLQPNETDIITQTKQWLSLFIIEYNICPFAKREVDNNRVRYAVESAQEVEPCLIALIDECEFLERHPEVETTLVIYNSGFRDFFSFLDYLDLADQLLPAQGYEGILQLASFHPDYCFAETESDDASNYTNRSPWPMLHLIREDSIEKALAHYPNPENIPQRNIRLTRELGQPLLQNLLNSIYNA